MGEEGISLLSLVLSCRSSEMVELDIEPFVYFLMDRMIFITHLNSKRNIVNISRIYL